MSGRCRVVGAILALFTGALLVDTVPAWADARIGTAGDAGTELADGFRVPRGARLIGGVVPEGASPGSPSAVSSPRWSATLWLDTDAVSAYDAVTTQAAALGMGGIGPLSSSGCATTNAPRALVDGDAIVTSVQCQEFLEGGGLSATLRILVCAKCNHPVASMQLSVQETGAARPADARALPPLPAGAPTARLTSAQQRAAVRAVPKSGESFTEALPVADFPTVVPGSQALSPALSSGCSSTGSISAVLALNGDGHRAVRAFLREGDPQGPGPRHTGSVKFHGLTGDAYRYGYYTTLVVVRGGDHGTFATVEWCND